MDRQGRVSRNESKHTSELQTDCNGSDDELICCEHGNPCDKYQQSDQTRLYENNMVLNEWCKTGYIGEQSRVSAEEICANPVSFHLYHRYPSRLTTSIEYSTSDSLLKAKLPLFVVYKTSQGEYRHYRVLDESKPDDLFTHKRANTWNLAYKVDIPGERTFPSLKALVDFYSTYVILHSKSHIVDVFPWWKDSQNHMRRTPDWAQRKSSNAAASSPHNSQCSCKFNCGGHFDSDSAILVTVPSTYGQPKNKKKNSHNHS